METRDKLRREKRFSEFKQQRNRVKYMVREAKRNFVHYVKGVEVFEMIAKQRMTLSKVKFYAAELLAAVDNLHKHGIVHRDIKNKVMADDEGHVCLIDFELATDQEKGGMGDG
nr:hypothetical protein BaRGS_030115 [Batillaria attramentaria]